MRIRRAAHGLLCCLVLCSTPVATHAVTFHWKSKSLAEPVLWGPLSFAGGGFQRHDPESPKSVDLTAEVKSHCTSITEKTLAHGVRVEVLHAPRNAQLAEYAMGSLERLHDVLVKDFELRFTVGGRLYLVELESYPPSLSMWDESDRVAVFVLMEPPWTLSEKQKVIDGRVLRSLAHEWAHGIFSQIYPRKSGLTRSQWIDEGFASFVAYCATRRLSPELFDELRAQHLPRLNLEEVGLSGLADWRIDGPRKMPLEVNTRMYSASLELFLQVEKEKGQHGVRAFLDSLRGLRRIKREHIEAALVQITGRTFEELALVSSAERAQLYADGCAALSSPVVATRAYGLAVLSKIGGLGTEHIDLATALVLKPDEFLPNRAVAATLLARDGTPRMAATLLAKLRQSAEVPYQSRVELPLVLRMAEEFPECAVDDLARLSGVLEGRDRDRVLEKLETFIGKKPGKTDLKSPATKPPGGSCPDVAEPAAREPQLPAPHR